MVPFSISLMRKCVLLCMRLSTDAVHRDPKGEGNQVGTGCTVG